MICVKMARNRHPVSDELRNASNFLNIRARPKLVDCVCPNTRASRARICKLIGCGTAINWQSGLHVEYGGLQTS